MEDSFDDELEHFLASVQENAQFDSAIDEGHDSERAVRRQGMLELFSDHGITAVVTDPRFEDTELDSILTIRVVATQTGPVEEGSEAQTGWSLFASALLDAKSLLDDGTGEDDPFAFDTAKEAITNILVSKEISFADKEAAIRVCKTFLGQGIVDRALASLGFDTEVELSADPVFDMRLSLLKLHEAEVQSQASHNRWVIDEIRPRLQENLTSILPAEHDDFKQLLDAVETAVRVQFYPEIEALSESDQLYLTEALTVRFKRYFEGLIQRHELDVSVLVDIALKMKPLYQQHGYRSVESI